MTKSLPVIITLFLPPKILFKKTNVHKNKFKGIGDWALQKEGKI